MDNEETKKREFYKLLDEIVNGACDVSIHKTVGEKGEFYRASIIESFNISVYGESAQKAYDNAMFELKTLGACFISAGFRFDKE